MIWPFKNKVRVRPLDGDPVETFEGADAEMNAAQDEARKALPIFWDRHSSSDDTESFGLKVGLSYPPNGTEHVWVDGVSREGDHLVGYLACDPMYLQATGFGDRVEFTVEQVSDWTYSKDGKQYGNFTTRVIAGRLHPADAADILSVLSPTPLEPLN